ncbi:aldehyde dehydrogenase [Oligoflexaceae bacterium]|nr:aldehyde dehydrogenase [Oligoflexaceae bacterium]
MNLFKSISSNDVTHFIAGEETRFSGENQSDNISPIDGSVTNKLLCGDTKAVQSAVDSAKHALSASDWMHRPVADRAKVVRRLAELIHENKEDLAQLETLDTGKPISETLTGDIPRAAQNFSFFADLAERESKEVFTGPGDSQHVTSREAVGIVGLITPWNLPLYLESWKVAPALVCGNAVILKPAELTPMTALALGHLALKAGLPPGLLNIVQGLGPNAAGEKLVAHPDVSAISFTGETTTGQAIAAVASPMLKKLSFELGGKGASVVFADAQLDLAAKTVVRAAFRNQGQICLAGSRLLVHSQIKDEFIKRVLAHIKEIRLGDPREKSTTMGTLVSHSHRDRVAGFVERSVESGAQILAGGRKPSSAGAFYEPTLVDKVQQGSEMIQSEVFGPVLTVQTFEDQKEALSMANDTCYGLSTSVWTQDQQTMESMCDGLRTGLVWQNSWFLRNLNSAFGGMKKSGVGREGGRYSLDFFSELKTVSKPKL